MEHYWKDLPEEIIHLILKFTGKVVYRDNRYININKLKGDYPFVQNVYKTQLKNKEKLYFSADNIGWYFDFSFEKHIGKPSYRHGLCYSFNFDYPGILEVCYFCERRPEPGEGGTAWVQIRTNFDLPKSVDT